MRKDGCATREPPWTPVQVSGSATFARFSSLLKTGRWGCFRRGTPQFLPRIGMTHLRSALSSTRSRFLLSRSRRWTGPFDQIAERWQTICGSLLFARQLVAVCRECFAKCVAGTAASRILMACTARLAGCRGVRRQCSGRFGSGNRQRSTNHDRRNDRPQDFQIHLSSPLVGMNQDTIWIPNADESIHQHRPREHGHLSVISTADACNSSRVASFGWSANEHRRTAGSSRCALPREITMPATARPRLKVVNFDQTREVKD